MQIASALMKVHYRFALLWKIGIYTGLRISDLLTLKSSQVLPGGRFAIYESKTGKRKEISLDAEILGETKGYVKFYGLRPNDFLFFSHVTRKHKPMTRQWAHRVIAREGLKFARDSLGAHSMRKIYACNKYASTGSLESVQRDLNHKYVSTTLIYLKDLLEQGIKNGP